MVKQRRLAAQSGTPAQNGVLFASANPVMPVDNTVDIVSAMEGRIERRIRDGVVQGKALPVEVESQFKNMRFL
jgi:hypothetical protein